MAIGKIVTRAVGGIVGKGSKNVNPVYKNIESVGKQKVERRVQKLNEIADARTGGEIGYVYKKGQMIDVSGTYSPIKVKPRNIGKITKQMAPDNKKQTKIIDKSIKQTGLAIKPNVKVNPSTASKVPVKKSKGK